MRRVRSITLRTLLLLAAVPAGCQAPPVVATDAEQEFAYLDHRGPRPLAGKRFVRVRCGELTQSEFGRVILYEYGFLLEEDPSSFVLFTIDGLTHRHERRDPARGSERTYEVLDLATEAGRFLALRKERLSQASERVEVSWLADPREPFSPHWMSPHLDEPSRTVVLAWACARTGHEALARDLYALAVRLRAALNSRGLGPDRSIFSSEGASRTLIWDAIVQYGAGSLTRVEIRERLIYVSKWFDHERRYPRIREMAATLEEMIEEDAERARRADRAPASASIEDRVAGLIFALRDQRGATRMIPGEAELLGPPGDELTRIGLPAVPQLIQALGDPRLTRMVENLRPYYFSHSILRVGDAALRILEGIAGRRFLPRVEPTEGLLMDGRLIKTQRAVNAWWESARPR